MRYSTIRAVDGTGPVTIVKPAKRCNSKCAFGERCRGVHGHAGPHWKYDERGWLQRWTTKGKHMLGPGIAHESIPPGNPGYISPEAMMKHDVSMHTKYETRERTKAEQGQDADDLMKAVLGRRRRRKARRRLPQL